MNTGASSVLKVYLGASQSGGYLPYGHVERMSSAYGNDADAMLAKIQKYLDMDHPLSDWSQSDLGKEQQVFEALLAQSFPELSNVAVNALACRWSYSWR